MNSKLGQTVKRKAILAALIVVIVAVACVTYVSIPSGSKNGGTSAAGQEGVATLELSETPDQKFRKFAAKTTRVEIESWDEEARRALPGRIVELKEPEEVRVFLDLISLDPYPSACCSGNPRVRLHSKEGLITTFSICHGKAIRSREMGDVGIARDKWRSLIEYLARSDIEEYKRAAKENQ